MSQFDKLISFGRQVSIRGAATQGRTDFVWSRPISRRVAWTKTGLATNLRFFFLNEISLETINCFVLYCLKIFFLIFLHCFVSFSIVLYSLIYCFVPLPILCFQDVPRLVMSCRSVPVQFPSRLCEVR